MDYSFFKIVINNDSLEMIIKYLFTINGFKEHIRQIEMSDNDEKIIILSYDKLMVKNM
jgi:hypothetical protein